MRRLLRTMIAALALVMLVSCSGSGSDSGNADVGGGQDSGLPEPVGPGESGGDGSGGAVDDAERQIVTTATASLAVEDPADAAQQVSELVESVGGRVDERNEQSGTGADGVEGARADLVVRVPATELTGVLADLKELGDVENVSVSRSDVTSTAVDLDARISALQTSVERLQRLLANAATTSALLEAEQALSDRQAELESLQSQRALLADQVELSTLSVHLETAGVAPAGGPDGFLDGLGTGWRALVSVLAAAVVVLGVLLPWLAVAGVVTAGVLVPIRMTRRRRPAVTAPPAPTYQQAPPPPATQPQAPPPQAPPPQAPPPEEPPATPAPHA